MRHGPPVTHLSVFNWQVIIYKHSWTIHDLSLIDNQVQSKMLLRSHHVTSEMHFQHSKSYKTKETLHL